MAVFIFANFVAVVFLTWLPSYLNRTFHMSLTMAGFSATAYLQVASVLGVLTGGMVADAWVRKDRRGRMFTQAVGLFAGVPFLLLTGWTFQRDGVRVRHHRLRLLQGHVRREHLGVAARRGAAGASRDGGGLMNSIGWLGGGVAPVAIASASGVWGMGACLSATSAVYALAGSLLLLGSAKWMRKGRYTHAA